MIGFALVGVVCDESGAGFMDVAMRKNGLDMAGKPVMAKLMGHAKALEPFIIYMCGVTDGKLIADPHEHARDPAGGGLGVNQNAE
jgi:tetrahydromethanopterin S-methyltransferase subunit H